MKKYLSLFLILLTFAVFAQLRANNTESYYSMKGTFNSDKKEIIKKTIEKEFGEGILEESGYIWTGRGSFEIILNDNSLKMEIQKSTDNQEIVDKIKNLGDKILATKNINKSNT